MVLIFVKKFIETVVDYTFYKCIPYFWIICVLHLNIYVLFIFIGNLSKEMTHIVKLFIFK